MEALLQLVEHPLINKAGVAAVLFEDDAPSETKRKRLLARLSKGHAFSKEEIDRLRDSIAKLSQLVEKAAAEV